jgi:PTH1 family peptidyl-tRNA hydrolase
LRLANFVVGKVSDPLKLIVGLGNPGSKYEFTRHNAGFLVVDKLSEVYKADSWSSKFDAQFAKAVIEGEASLLVKPMTFMNLSGRSVAQFVRFYKIPVEDIVVLHDDIDVPFGKVKARQGGGHGGHNGIRSLMSELGQSAFQRVKLGVGRPAKVEDGDVVNWVLKRFSDAELDAIQTSMVDETSLRLKGMFLQSKKRS